MTGSYLTEIDFGGNGISSQGAPRLVDCSRLDDTRGHTEEHQTCLGLPLQVMLSYDTTCTHDQIKSHLESPPVWDHARMSTRHLHDHTVHVVADPCEQAQS